MVDQWRLESRRKQLTFGVKQNGLEIHSAEGQKSNYAKDRKEAAKNRKET
jgi:hypothetical protein